MPLSPLPEKVPCDLRCIEDDRRIRAPEPHREPVELELLADDPAAARGQPQRRLAEPPVQHRAAEPARRTANRRRPALETIAEPTGQTGSRVGPSWSEPVWRKAKLTSAQAVPKAKLPPLPMPAADRHSQRAHPPVRERPVERRDRAQLGRTVAPRGEADRRQREARALGRIRRELGHAAHRRAVARLGEC